MDKLQAIRGIAFDLDGTLVDSAPGLTSAVDNALYALELPVAGEERCLLYTSYSQLKPHSSLLQHRRRDLHAQHRLFELHRSGAAFATGNLIGDLASLLDAGRLHVGGQ